MYSVEISEEAYKIYRPIIILFQIIGLFPATVHKKGSKLFKIKLSFLMLICGYIYGACAIFMAYWGIYIEISASKEDAIRITSDTDKLMYIIDVTAYSAVFFCGVFVVPSKYKCFFSYLQYLNKVDATIKTTYQVLEKYIHAVSMMIVVVINTALGGVDLSDSYKIAGDKLGVVGVIHRYLAMDFLASVANIFECTNQILLFGVRRRIQKLNILLKYQYDRMKKRKPMDLKKVSAKSVRKLSESLQIILDANDMLSELLGACTVAMVLGIVWGLIESSYFFLLVISGNRGELRDAIEIPGTITIVAFHVFRMLLITEPSYACLSEIQITKCLVCKLLSCNVDSQYRKEVKRLAMVLELRRLEFSACGLFVVDRALFTSLLDTIVTLLVILLQYRNDFEI